MRRFCVALLALAAGLASLAEPVPYGSKDFYPSPERPVGYRGDGNAAWPGAHIVTEFWDGTPVERDAMVEKRGRMIPGKRWALDDDKSRNIVWKTEMPSWANTQPIVVGDRVITLAHPDQVLCADANTGKILWTRTCNPWLAGGEEPKTADRLRQLSLAHEALYNFSRWSGEHSPWAKRRDGDTVLKLEPTLLTGIEQMLDRVGRALTTLDPDAKLEPAAQAAAASFRAIREKGECTVTAAQAAGGGVGKLADMLRKRMAAQSKHEVTLEQSWGNMVGYCMAAPVSDGQFVYVAFAQGQTACYDLNGNCRWMRLMGDLDPARDRGNYQEFRIRSPLLYGDTLVDFNSPDLLRGLDAKTGETRWQAVCKVGGRSIGTYKVILLNNGKEDVPLLVCGNPGERLILRLADGAVLGKIPYADDGETPRPRYDGQSVQSCGDIVYMAATGDNYSRPFTAYRLKFDGDDKVLAEKLWEIRDSGYYQGSVVTPSLYVCYWGSRERVGLYDPKTGTQLSRIEGLDGYSLGLAGSTLFWARQADDTWWGTPLVRFTMADLANPAQPGPVSDRNFLQMASHVPSPAMDTYAPELYAHPQFVGTWGGQLFWALHTDNGVFPSGNRLFIRTTTHLYCIGDPAVPYDWNPASRPQAVMAMLETEAR